MAGRTTFTAALILATLASTVPASAQYYYGYGDGGPRRGYDRGYDDGPRYERRRRYDEEYDEPPRRRFGRGGSLCVTARGNCMTRPLPYGAPCGCEIPGFGYKRGAVGD